jgi:isopenicillin N synthase-like dioxygenase
LTVHPIPGAITVNTGDMAQIWSNGKYQAPLHRVLTNRNKVRYLAPFFYNPGYETWVEPIDVAAGVENNSHETSTSEENNIGEDDSNNPKNHKVSKKYHPQGE